MDEGPSPNWSAFIQALSWAGAVLTALLGAVGFFISQGKARIQRREELAQRERELRWRQASAAWTSIEKLEADPKAAEAMLMLDWDGRSYPTGAPPEQQWSLTQSQMLKALRTDDISFSAHEAYVRDVFDRLFWHFEWFQSQINAGLITLSHIHFPISYYVSLMNKNWDIFENYLLSYNYLGAAQLAKDMTQRGLPQIMDKSRKQFAPLEPT